MVRLFRWVGAWGRDFGYAFRAVRNRPVVALLAVITIALGIGVSTAIFSIVNAILLQPPPYKDPDSLVMVWNLNEREGYTYEDTKSRGQSMSPAEFLDWKNESGVFEDMVAFGPMLAVISETDDPEMTHGYRLTEGGFRMLGVEPILGRLPTIEEEQDPQSGVIVLRHNLWQRRFHSDPNVIDQTIKLFNQEVRIIGVLPPEFVFFNRQSEFLSTMAFNERMAQQRSFRGFRVMARLQEGMTIEEAQARAGQFSRQMEQRHPDTNKNWHVNLYSIADDTVGDLQQAMKVLLAAVGFVLLIMCVNVANLLLVQASARTRELAVRSALGAGRWRLVRQLLGESMLLSVTGGVLGLGLAFGLVRYFQAMLPDRYTHGKYLPQLEAIDVSWPVVLFAFAVALLTGLLFGMIPAVRASKPNFNEDLKDSARGSGGGLRTRGLRGALVVAEVAVGLILVIGAALLVRSFAALYQNGPGLQSSGLLTLVTPLPTSEIFEEARDQGLTQQDLFQFVRSRLVALNDRLFADAAAVPGVESVAATSNLPMQGWFSPSEFTIEGRPQQSARDAPQSLSKTVTPNYFQTMGIPLLRGRTFEDLDLPDSQRVVVIGDQLAEQYFPNEDPIGKRIKRGGPDSRDAWATIVGVVGSIREAGMDTPAGPAFYLSQTQQPLSFMYLVLKTSGDPTAVLPGLRRAVEGVHSGIPIYRVREMEDIVRDSAWQLNYSMMLMSGLAGLALLLALVGVYGVLSHAVRERTQEIGVRVALGADRKAVLGLVLRHGMVLVAIGAGIGFIGAAGLTRFLSALLFGVESLDWPTFGVSAAALLAIGAVASYFPARRATRIQPIEALRHE
jgi:putative ABC transport system permease protein